MIDRIYDQNVGYWEANLQGLAHPGRLDRAELLVDYLASPTRKLLKQPIVSPQAEVCNGSGANQSTEQSFPIAILSNMLSGSSI